MDAPAVEKKKNKTKTDRHGERSRRHDDRRIILFKFTKNRSLHEQQSPHYSHALSMHNTPSSYESTQRTTTD